MEEKDLGDPPKTQSGNASYWTFGVVALLIVVGIIWYAGTKKESGSYRPYRTPISRSTQSSQQTGQPANNSQKQAAAVIEYNDTGFSPQNVTIKSGEVVEFKNVSSGGMWIASAPHPLHTDYPEFDAKKEYKKGESYFFTFEKTGTWKFHNHLDPTRFGSVTVQ